MEEITVTPKKRQQSKQVRDILKHANNSFPDLQFASPKILKSFMKYVFLPITLLFLASCSNIKNENITTYEAGFRIIQTVDKSRIYKPRSDTSDYLHFRPLDIDIWYPAKSSSTDSALLFRDILGLLEKRANYYTGSNAGNGVTRQIAQYLCDGFKCSDTTRLLNFKTNSFKDANPVKAKFPLVIYLCAYNGMSFENFTLFEELAKKGFIVVSISSIGRYPGDMTMKNEDLVEQVNDAVAALNTLKQDREIDFSKIGVIGYSWGGLAGSALAGKIPNVACIVSLDESEFHHYGTAKGENEDFNGIRNSNLFKNMRLPMPYLRLESSPLAGTDKEDSIYNFSEKLGGKKFIFKIDSAQHEDFGCLPKVVRESGGCNNNQYFNRILKLATAFLEDNLKNAITFSHAIEEAGNRIEQKKIRNT